MTLVINIATVNGYGLSIKVRHEFLPKTTNVLVAHLTVKGYSSLVVSKSSLTYTAPGV